MTKDTIILIDGNFYPSSAQSILIELINHKINFHGSEKFSKELRFGKENENSESRINELIEDKNKLIRWFNSLDNTTSIKIDCLIEIQISEK